MDERTLKAFITLADTLHFSKTSEICNLTNSTLTRMIQRVEEEFGATFFKRTKRSVMITSEGMKFYEYARKSLDDWHKIRESIHDNDPESISGELRIACSAISGSDAFTGHMVEVFHQTYKKTIPKLFIQPPEKALHGLETGENDFVLMMLHDDEAKASNVHKVIVESEYILVYPKGWDEPKSFEDLKDLPFIASHINVQHTRNKSIFKKHQLKPQVKYVAEGVFGTLGLVEHGLGAAFVPEYTFKQYKTMDKLAVAKQVKTGEKVRIALIMKKNAYHSPAKMAFWETIANHKEYSGDII